MPRTAQNLLLPTAVCGLIAIGLLGCTPEQPAATHSPSPEASASAPASTTPPPAPAVFVLPASCTAMLGAALEASFLGDGNVLFSGPGGAGIYPMASVGQDGGSPVSCLYGKDMVDLSTFELSVQSLDQGAHEGTIAELNARGMTRTTDGEVVTYTQLGSEGASPTIVHVVRPDSWITAYSALGGAERAALAAGWATTVAQQVYRTP